MAEGLDLEKLLKDIPGQSPAGPDLRGTPVYRQVKGLVEDAQRAERRHIDGTSADEPDWNPVLKLVPDVLAKQSKDLELAAWLTKALAGRRSFEGLRDGMKLMRCLVESFWDRGLHPSFKAYPLDEGLRMVAALNKVDNGEGLLVRAINRVPLTEKIDEMGPFSRLDYVAAGRVEAISDPAKRNEEIKKGVPDFARIQKAESATQQKFRDDTLALIEQCLAESNQLGGLLARKCRGAAAFAEGDFQDSKELVAQLKAQADAVSKFVWSRFPDDAKGTISRSGDTDPVAVQNRLAAGFEQIAGGIAIYAEPRFAGVELSEETKEFLGSKPDGIGMLRLNRMLLEDAFELKRSSHAPSTSAISEALEECRSIVKGDKVALKEDKKEKSDDENNDSEQADVPKSFAAPGPIQDRKVALKQLTEIARYFKKTEPHSPISYALERIVRWGDLPLPILLAEIIEDKSARTGVCKMVGIPEEKEK